MVHMGLKVYEKTFEGTEAFEAIRKAEAWLKERGYSVGTMQGPAPMGIMKGDYDIAKWRNLRPSERYALDGQIDGDKRNGPVTVRLKCARECE
jgi:hypothetical protein